jgi:hypothetical protein
MKYSGGHAALGQGRHYFYVRCFSICSHTRNTQQGLYSQGQRQIFIYFLRPQHNSNNDRRQ